MNKLKKKISSQELLVMVNRTQLEVQISQFKKDAKNWLISPLGLSSSFIVGFLVMFLINPKKGIRKTEKNYLSFMNRLKGYLSLFFSLSRFFSFL